MSVRFISNVLVPGWIMIFGLVALMAPPLGVETSLWLFVVGGGVVPALMLVPLRGPLAPTGV